MPSWKHRSSRCSSRVYIVYSTHSYLTHRPTSARYPNDSIAFSLQVLDEFQINNQCHRRSAAAGDARTETLRKHRDPDETRSPERDVIRRRRHRKIIPVNRGLNLLAVDMPRRSHEKDLCRFGRTFGESAVRLRLVDDTVA